MSSKKNHWKKILHQALEEAGIQKQAHDAFLECPNLEEACINLAGMVTMHYPGHKRPLLVDMVAGSIATFVKNKKVDAKCDLALSELVRNAHMLLSKRISIRHGKAHVAWLPFEEALQDFLDRHDGSVPEVIEEVSPGELEADMASLLLASRIMPIASAKRICCEFFPKACRQCE